MRSYLPTYLHAKNSIFRRFCFLSHLNYCLSRSIGKANLTHVTNTSYLINMSYLLFYLSKPCYQHDMTYLLFCPPPQPMWPTCPILFCLTYYKHILPTEHILTYTDLSLYHHILYNALSYQPMLLTCTILASLTYWLVWLTHVINMSDTLQ